MALPLFFPTIKYVKRLDRSSAMPLEALCALAGVPCHALGRWTQRPVILCDAAPDGEPWIRAEPGDWNAVEVGLPLLPNNVARARWALGALAFAVFDGVARASVARQRSGPAVGAHRSTAWPCAWATARTEWCRGCGRAAQGRAARPRSPPIGRFLLTFLAPAKG